MDEFLEDYLFFNFENIKRINIPRSYQIEDKVAAAAKLNFALEGFLTDTAIPKDIPYALQHLKGSVAREDFYKIRNSYYEPVSVRGAEKLVVDKFPLRLPWVNYCSKKLMKNLWDFADTYAEELTRALPQSLEVAPSTTDAQHPLYISKSGGISNYLRVGYAQNKKIYLPFFHYDAAQTIYASPDNEGEPIYNVHLLGHAPKAIILTDCLELAHRNQHLLSQSGIRDIVWVSWNNRPDLLKKVDWTPLVGHQVYYLLTEHSALGTADIYDTAMTVQEKLEDAGVKALKYISLFQSMSRAKTMSPAASRSPTVYTKDEVQRFANNEITEGHDALFSLDFFKAKIAFGSTGRKRLLLSNIIQEQSVNLICGPNTEARQLFTLSLARACASKLKLFDGVHAPRPSEVLYVSGVADDAYLEEQLEVLRSLPASKHSYQGKLKVLSLAESAGITGLTPYQRISKEIKTGFGDSETLPRLLIIDGIDLPAIEKNKQMTEVKNWTNSLMDDKWTVLFVTEISKAAATRIHKGFQFGSITEMKELPLAEPNEFAISLNTLKSYKGSAKLSSVSAIFSFNDERPRWQNIKVKIPIFEELKEINKLLAQKKTTKAVSMAMGGRLSESMVKKRKRQIYGKEEVRDPDSDVRFWVIRDPLSGHIRVDDNANYQLNQYHRDKS